MSLEAEGYLVDEARTAEAGLDLLHHSIFDLILTDFALPRRSGTWMLRAAAREGLLNAPAFLLTAHPSPGVIAGVPVITKPLDLDAFLDRIRETLDPAVYPSDEGGPEGPPPPNSD